MTWISNLVGAIKTILINILIILVPLIALDTYFLFDKLDFRTDGFGSQITCGAELTNYDYCPSFTHLNYMSLADRWLPVINYIGAQRRSIYVGDRPKVTKEPKIFLLGDSFIQAEEMPIESRFEHAIRLDGYDVEARGYSSWNSVQFLSIAKEIDVHPGDHVFFFSMGNDYTPNYVRASVNTHIGYTEYPSPESDRRSFLRKIYENSLVLNTYRRSLKVALAYFERSGSGISYPLRSSHDESNYSDCSTIPSLADVASEDVLEYIVLSKSDECWPKDIEDSVAYNVDLLNEAFSVVRQSGGIPHLVMIPAGWVFPNQNTIGRIHPLYSIPVGKTIGQKGLIDRLNAEGLEVIDLQPVLASESNKGFDSTYYPADGHFNERSHEIIGRYLLQLIGCREGCELPLT